MTQSRPNYILELKDGRTIEFVPHGQCDHTWVGSGRQFHVSMLEAIGATPVPQEEPVGMEYRLTFAKWGDPCKEVPLYFKSNEDAENYRRRCESIGPEWTDWEPEDGQTVYVVGGSTERFRKSDPEDTANRLSGIYHPTKERAQEWLEKFGKAWGLM